VIFSCYFSPNRLMSLSGTWTHISPSTSVDPYILGDFNARSHLWNRGRVNPRGKVLLETNVLLGQTGALSA